MTKIDPGSTWSEGWPDAQEGDAMVDGKIGFGESSMHSDRRGTDLPMAEVTDRSVITAAVQGGRRVHCDCEDRSEFLADSWSSRAKETSVR